jgi:hypothetical protein
MSNIIECENNWIIFDNLKNVSDLKNLIEDIDTTDYSEYTTATGNSTQRSFTHSYSTWGPPEKIKGSGLWEEVKIKYEDIVKDLLVKYKKFDENHKNLSIEIGWTVTGEEGSYHTIHEHGNDGVSVIVYTEVPKHEDIFDNGMVYFVLQSDYHDGFMSPFQRLPRFSPEEGLILIFPSWVVHGTYPQKEGTRTTVSFDLKYNE